MHNDAISFLKFFGYLSKFYLTFIGSFVGAVVKMIVFQQPRLSAPQQSSWCEQSSYVSTYTVHVPSRFWPNTQQLMRNSVRNFFGWALQTKQVLRAHVRTKWCHFHRVTTSTRTDFFTSYTQIYVFTNPSYISTKKYWVLPQWFWKYFVYSDSLLWSLCMKRSIPHVMLCFPLQFTHTRHIKLQEIIVVFMESGEYIVNVPHVKYKYSSHNEENC